MQNSDFNYYEIIASNIRILRTSKNLSQEKFAESIDCSREYISRLENNREKISLSLLLSISRIYNIPPEFFFQKNTEFV